jgi:hypothetical protein
MGLLGLCCLKTVCMNGHFLGLTFFEFIYPVAKSLRFFSDVQELDMYLAWFGRSMTGMSSHYSWTWTGRMESIFHLMQIAVCATYTPCTGLQPYLFLFLCPRLYMCQNLTGTKANMLAQWHLEIVAFDKQ